MPPTLYILASQTRGTLNVGVTSDPLGRWWTHRAKIVEGLTKRHGVTVSSMSSSSATWSTRSREKQRKRWHRDWKINLIEAANLAWRDLAVDYGLEPVAQPRAARMDAETSSA